MLKGRKAKQKALFPHCVHLVALISLSSELAIIGERK